MITVSAPGKIHLLGEHTVVYGKPAILATVNLRTTVTLSPPSGVIARSEATRQSSSDKSPIQIASLIARNDDTEKLQKIIEPIVKKYLNIKSIPPYQLEISSQLPVGAGLGSSAAVSAAYVTALLSFLEIKWDLNLINELTFEAEKVFHGNPSGGDNSTVVFGGLIWFRKESPDLKIIQPVPFTIPKKLAKNFCLINTGKPEETTKQMVEIVRVKGEAERVKFKKIFDHQEQLVRELLLSIQGGNENQLIQIIRAGEKNLETIGAVSPSVKSIIRKIEQAGGAAKICGAGGTTKATGILLVYHPNKTTIKKIAKDNNLPAFQTQLGVTGVKMETKSFDNPIGQ